MGRRQQAEKPALPTTLRVRPSVGQPLTTRRPSSSRPKPVKEPVEAPPAVSAVSIRKARQAAATTTAPPESRTLVVKSSNEPVKAQPTATRKRSSSSSGSGQESEASAKKQPRTTRASDPHSAVPDSLFHNDPLPEPPRRQPKSSHSNNNSNSSTVSPVASTSRHRDELPQENHPKKQKKARYFVDEPVQASAPKKSSGRASSIQDLTVDTDESDEEEEQDAPPASAPARPARPPAASPEQSAESSVSESSDGEPEPTLQSEPSTSRPPSPAPALDNEEASSDLFVPQDGVNIARVRFRPNSKLSQRYSIAQTQQAILLGLRLDDAVSLCGTARLFVLAGRVSVHEALLDPESQALDLFAPNTHVLPRITALPSSSSSSLVHLESLIKTATFDPPLQSSAFREAEAVVLLAPMTDTGVEGLEDLVKLSGILPRSGSMWTRSSSSGTDAGLGSSTLWSGTGFEVVHRKTPTFPAPYPSDWSNALHKLEEASQGVQSPIVAFSGPKRAGKSTLAKCVLNRLCRTCPRVAWLDLDLGQAEFTPPGLVSLHLLTGPAVNPNFTQQKQPHRAHHVGDTNPAQDPDSYVAAVKDLVHVYRQLNKEDPLPLIINNYGSSKGLAGDLLDTIMTQVVQPTHILRFSSASTPAPQATLLETAVFEISPLPDSEAARTLTAADHRTLAQLSYFYQTSCQKWDLTQSVSAKPFMSIKWTDLQQIHIVGSEVVYDHALSALNASMVGLVASDPPPTPADTSTVDRPGQLPYSQLASSPDPAHSHCLGFGIVRSISPETQELHILTSLPGSALERCNTLVRGKVELPTAFLLHGGSTAGVNGLPWSQVPYLEASNSTRPSLPGDTKRHVRRNAVRAGQS